jgi:hypothetical protein
MKVIGKNNNDYICIISHTEVEKVVGKYYGNLKRLDIEETIDLGVGYDFRSDIVSTCQSMKEAMKSFERSKNTLLQFANMVTSLPASESEQKS